MRYILALLLLASCSVSRQVDKTYARDEEQDYYESGKSYLDQTVTKTEEKVDTCVVVPGVQVIGESRGVEFQSVSDGDTLKAVYDPKSNVIKAKFVGKTRSITVLKDKKTEVTANVKQEEKVRSDSSRVTVLEEKHKEYTQKVHTWYFWLGLIAIVAIVLFILRKKIVPFINVIKAWFI